MSDFHPIVKQLLDGEATLADLPAELRAEGEEALRLLGAVDRRPVELPGVTQRVRRALASRSIPRQPLWKRALEQREMRVSIRPWLLGPMVAVAAVLILWLWPARP